MSGLCVPYRLLPRGRDGKLYTSKHVHIRGYIHVFTQCTRHYARPRIGRTLLHKPDATDSGFLASWTRSFTPSTRKSRNHRGNARHIIPYTFIYIYIYVIH